MTQTLVKAGENPFQEEESGSERIESATNSTAAAATTTLSSSDKFYATASQVPIAWFPLLPLSELSQKETIKGLFLLERPLVLFKDPETQQIAALDDKCAHRSVKLRF